MKADSGAYAVIGRTGTFALNMLAKGQQGAALAFFKPAQRDGDKVGAEPARKGGNGAPLRVNALAAVECKVVETVRRGDHHIVVGEVVEAHLNKPVDGRPDAAVLEMKYLGDNVFYGG